MGFQLTATIVVTAEGQPPQSSESPVGALWGCNGGGHKGSGKSSFLNQQVTEEALLSCCPRDACPRGGVTVPVLPGMSILVQAVGWYRCDQAVVCHTARVPVFLTVTPANEFTPVCPSGTTFTVTETAAFGSSVGYVTGTDRDYPQNSLEYRLEGGPGPAQPFAVDTQTGECLAPSLAVVAPYGTCGCPAAHTALQARSVWWGPWTPSGTRATG